MTNAELKQEKSLLRKNYRQERNDIPEDEKIIMSQKIAEAVTGSVSFAYADAVLLYYPCRGEVDTRQIFFEAVRQGKRCYYPKTQDGGIMKFIEVFSEDDFEQGRFGLSEPVETGEVFEDSLHPICIVPALAFDKKGYRLGYGGGYYDRFLPKFSGISIGVQYGRLVKDELLRDKRHDRKVDILATEKGLCVIG